MIAKPKKNEIRERIHKRIRRKLQGTEQRPRLAVFRSVAHIYAQVIDDSKGHTLVAASSVEKAGKANGGNVAAAKAIGKSIAERAKEKGIKQVVFDRGGYQYHGRVKALADAAREAGLEF
jgi:large subunit ribosomal protein L18